jgi:hypothetical protein
VKTHLDHVSKSPTEVVRLRSPQLDVEVAPELGGRIVQIRHRGSGHEFLWNNAGLPLAPQPPGSPYDPNFYGGIDELIPNDIPEVIDGIACPDHGELWTTPLRWNWDESSLSLQGQLPLFGLNYERRMTLRPDRPMIDLRYRIVNESNGPRHFMWKLHAAIAVAEGDEIECPARHAQVVDLQYSRFTTLTPFEWPEIEGERANFVPARDGTVDFFYLYGLLAGRIAWKRPIQKLKFEYQFDTATFPFAWLFATYGGFDGHYTAILEPCTTMPISVNDAISIGRCSRLEPGESLLTDVSIYAGPFE